MAGRYCPYARAERCARQAAPGVRGKQFVRRCATARPRDFPVVQSTRPRNPGKPRRGIVFEYRADDAYQISDKVWKDTGLLMCGKRKEHVRCEPGIIRLPKQNPESEFYTGQVFGSAFNQNGELVDQSEYYRDRL